jgi:hypothetical protein
MVQLQTPPPSPEAGPEHCSDALAGSPLKSFSAYDIEHLSGEMLHELEEALKSAFPNVSMLERMVVATFGKNLIETVGGSNLTEVVFNLIKWTRQSGCLRELIVNAHTSNPENYKLRVFVQKIGLVE